MARPPTVIPASKGGVEGVPRRLYPWVACVGAAGSVAFLFAGNEYAEVVTHWQGAELHLWGSQIPFHGLWIQLAYAFLVFPSLAWSYWPFGTRPRPRRAAITVALCALLTAVALWDAAIAMPSTVEAWRLDGAGERVPLYVGREPKRWRVEHGAGPHVVLACCLVSLVGAVGHFLSCVRMRRDMLAADRARTESYGGPAAVSRTESGPNRY